MNYIRRSNERGGADFGWLQSKHSFSFGSYYDPAHMGVSVLRVINDDVVQPSRGFDTHGHQDMEIISYVTEGALEHKDSEGNMHTIPAGDIQRMSAGTGIRHSEYNASNTDNAKFLQIWLMPKVLGIKPGYEQKSVPQQGKLTAIVTPNGKAGSLSMNQDASLYRLVLAAGEDIKLKANNSIGYLHIVKGTLSAGDKKFSAGDAFGIDAGESVELNAQNKLEALWFDLPST